jgi:hypothetical protein
MRHLLLFNPMMLLRLSLISWPEVDKKKGLFADNLPASFGAEVAQLAEHSPEKAGVDSSILSLGTTENRHSSGMIR